MKKYISLMTLTATAPLLLSGCGMNAVQIFNDIKGQPYANADKYTAREQAISTTSANVEIQTVFHCLSMGITTTSGKLSVALPEDGGRVSFVTVSGKLKTALPYEVVGDLRVFATAGARSMRSRSAAAWNCNRGAAYEPNAWPFVNTKKLACGRLCDRQHASFHLPSICCFLGVKKAKHSAGMITVFFYDRQILSALPRCALGQRVWKCLLAAN